MVPDSPSQPKPSLPPLQPGLNCQTGFLVASRAVPDHCQEHMGFTPFTSQTGLEFQKRSIASRKANQLAAQLERERRQPKAIAERIAITEKQLDRTDGLIDDCDDPAELLKLAQTKDKLVRVWQLLTGWQNPGTRRGRGNSGSTPTLPVPAPISQPVPPKPVT